MQTIVDLLNLSDFDIRKRYKEKYGSVEYLIAQAKNGDTSAQADLGFAYAEGIQDFVEKDFENASGWLNAAVENGDLSPSVCGKLGELLDLKGTPQHRRKAYEMYHQAAKMGCTKSQLSLAEMYRCGVEGVVNEDLKEAFEWYHKAAGEMASVSDLNLGTVRKIKDALYGTRTEALRLLYEYYREGDCPEGRPQPTKAVYYLTKAAEQGDTDAQRELGWICMTGSCEQVKDLRKAKRWLEKASDSGDSKASQLLQQCNLSKDTQHSASEVSEDAIYQSFSIMNEKLRRSVDAVKHPLAISQPFAFSEELLQQFNWSPTARIYLQAFKLVEEGLETLNTSKFTNGRGITFIAHGYLTENTILQAFPQIKSLSHNILHASDENLHRNPCFFEGLLLAYVLREKGTIQGVLTLKNLIYFIQEAEPNSPPCEKPFQFDENYSSWLHVLYYHLAAIYTISEDFERAAEAFENSLKCSPTYYDAKRGLGHSLMKLYTIKVSRTKNPSQDIPRITGLNKHDGEISKYDSWTAENLRNTAVTMLKEFLNEAPKCFKFYPNACYYLAKLANNRAEFVEYYELGQEAEERRLPFFDPVNLPLKDLMTPRYQLFANVQKRMRCGNLKCTKKVKESELKACSRCRKQRYCSKGCQTADWKNHKATCTALPVSVVKNG